MPSPAGRPAPGRPLAPGQAVPSERERLLSILAGAGADRPACVIPGGMMNMTTTEVARAAGVGLPQAHTDPAEMVRLARAAHDLAGIENYGVPFCMTVEAEGMGARVDLGGATCEPHVVSGVIPSAADLGELRPLDPTRGRAATTLEAIRALHGLDDGVPVVGNLVGAVSVAGTVLDMEVLLREMVRRREQAHALCELVAQGLVAYGRAMVEAGADVVCIAEPSGTGEILGPRLFGAYTVRYLNEVIAGIGAPATIVHICGRLDRVLDEVARIDCDAFSFDATISVRAMRERLPGRVLMGNVSTFALEEATPEKVRTMTGVTLRSGVDVVAPACGISMSTPTENLRAMTDAVRRWAPGRQGALDRASARPTEIEGER